MPKDPLAYKFTGAVNEDGTAAEFIHGLPSRDIHRSEFEGMPDEAKAALKASPLHRAYGDADKQAAKAERRVETATEEATAPAPVSTAPAPAEGKK